MQEVATEEGASFSIEDAESAAREGFGLKARAEALAGYEDENFLLRLHDGRPMILKIATPAVSATFLQAQHKVLSRLAAQLTDVAVPQLQSSQNGTPLWQVRDGDGQERLVRCYALIPGRFLMDVSQRTRALYHSIGDAMGRLAAALADMDHPGAHRSSLWNLADLTAVRAHLSALPEDKQHSIQALFDQADAVRAQCQGDLRYGLIHGDANDHNVLVSDEEPAQMMGLIDFGDMVYAPWVCDLAITCAYACMGSKDPMAACEQIVAAYHGQFPLRSAEIDCVFPLIRARLAMTVTMAAFQRQQRPDDAYYSISEQPAWELLAQLGHVHPRWATYRFRKACGLTAHPQTSAWQRWVREAAHDFVSVSQQDVVTAAKLVFDFSQMSEPPQTANVAQFTEVVFSEMAAAGATLGVGRFNEARGLYQSHVFLGDGQAEPRTVHLGIDLFEPAGAPVRAPLAGTVHSFADNANPLDYGATIVLRHDVDRGGLVFYTLYGHLARRSLQGLYPGKPIAAGETFAWLGDVDENGGWPPHLHFQVTLDMLDKWGDFPGVCQASLRDMWCDLCPDPNDILKMPLGTFGFDGPDAAAIAAVRSQHLSASLSLSYREPLYIVEGRGAYLFDREGRAYLDGVNNVCHVGHCHPHVVAAASQQLAELNTNTRYLHPEIARYAERLLATFPPALSVVFFVCTGSEANELALRLACTATGREDILVQDGAYHGNTSALVNLSPYKHDGPGGRGRPNHVHVTPMPDVYRGAHCGVDAGMRYADEAINVLCTMVDQGQPPAAFFAEPLLGCGGQIVPPPGYLRAAFEAVRAKGGLAVADEVQIGFGRVGSAFWGFAAQDALPDIVTLGKPIGNGFPLAAVVTTPAIAKAFQTGMEYFNTFGGNPVACAVGNAVLDVIESESLQDNARAVGDHLLAGLSTLAERHAVIGDVRGLGLYIGVELVKDRHTKEPDAELAADVVNAVKARGILLSTDGPLHNVLKIKPPLVFTVNHADQLVETLDRVFQQLTA